MCFLKIHPTASCLAFLLPFNKLKFKDKLYITLYFKHQTKTASTVYCVFNSSHWFLIFFFLIDCLWICGICCVQILSEQELRGLKNKQMKQTLLPFLIVGLYMCYIWSYIYLDDPEFVSTSSEYCELYKNKIRAIMYLTITLYDLNIEWFVHFSKVRMSFNKSTGRRNDKHKSTSA